MMNGEISNDTKKEETIMIKQAIEKVVRREDLPETEMEEVMEEIMTGKATPAQIGCFVTALRIKGETVDEITGAARAVRARAIKVQVNNHLINIDRDRVSLCTSISRGHEICGRAETGDRPENHL
jgi:anthranilate phosphoribosyltransferase